MCALFAKNLQFGCLEYRNLYSEVVMYRPIEQAAEQQNLDTLNNEHIMPIYSAVYASAVDGGGGGGGGDSSKATKK